MATLKLQVSDKILDKVLWLLNQFKPEDLQIIQPGDSFAANKKYAQEQLKRLESGKGRTYSLDQVDEMLEKTIRQNES